MGSGAGEGLGAFGGGGARGGGDLGTVRDKHRDNQIMGLPKIGVHVERGSYDENYSFLGHVWVLAPRPQFGNPHIMLAPLGF